MKSKHILLWSLFFICASFKELNSMNYIAKFWAKFSTLTQYIIGSRHSVSEGKKNPLAPGSQPPKFFSRYLRTSISPFTSDSLTFHWSKFFCECAERAAEDSIPASTADEVSENNIIEDSIPASTANEVSENNIITEIHRNPNSCNEFPTATPLQEPSQLLVPQLSVVNPAGQGSINTPNKNNHDGQQLSIDLPTNLFNLILKNSITSDLNHLIKIDKNKRNKTITDLLNRYRTISKGIEKQLTPIIFKLMDDPHYCSTQEIWKHQSKYNKEFEDKFKRGEALRVFFETDKVSENSLNQLESILGVDPKFKIELVNYTWNINEQQPNKPKELILYHGIIGITSAAGFCLTRCLKHNNEDELKHYTRLVHHLFEQSALPDKSLISMSIIFQHPPKPTYITSGQTTPLGLLACFLAVLEVGSFLRYEGEIVSLDKGKSKDIEFLSAHEILHKRNTGIFPNYTPPELVNYIPKTPPVGDVLRVLLEKNNSSLYLNQKTQKSMIYPNTAPVDVINNHIKLLSDKGSSINQTVSASWHDSRKADWTNVKRKHSKDLCCIKDELYEEKINQHNI